MFTCKAGVSLVSTGLLYSQLGGFCFVESEKGKLKIEKWVKNANCAK